MAWDRTARIVALGVLAGAALLVVVVVAASVVGRPPAAGAAGQPRKPTTKAAPITIAWAGDTTLGSAHGLPPDHGRPLLAAVRPSCGAPTSPSSTTRARSPSRAPPSAASRPRRTASR